MIAHSAPFAATAFLGMSLVLGSPLAETCNHNGDPDSTTCSIPESELSLVQPVDGKLKR